jgi:hypothetical protein
MRRAPGDWSRMRAAFYQLRPFASSPCIAALLIVAAGNLKPEIPTVGARGIPLRDEIELEKHTRVLMDGRPWRPW